MSDQPRYGTIGKLDYDELADALLCHVCGCWYRSLAQHARRAHGLSADDYRALAGLNRTTRLITPSMQARLRETSAPLIERLRAEGALRRWDEDPEKFARDKRAAVSVLRDGLRAEARERQRAAMSPARRAALAERRRQRNLAGEDRADPAAIAAGLRRAAGGPRPCDRCGATYQPVAPRQRYCAACRPEVQREQGRESARRRRIRVREGDDAAPARTNPLARDQSRDVACARCGARPTGDDDATRR